MRSVSYVQRVALEFSGSLFPHAICLGDVDNDTVSACALERHSPSATAGRGGAEEAARGGVCVLRVRTVWAWTACVARRAVRAACVRTAREPNREGLCGRLGYPASWLDWSGALLHCPSRDSRTGSTAWSVTCSQEEPVNCGGRVPSSSGAAFPFRASEIG